jgi:hypothetical protein
VLGDDAVLMSVSDRNVHLTSPPKLLSPIHIGTA